MKILAIQFYKGNDLRLTTMEQTGKFITPIFMVLLFIAELLKLTHTWALQKGLHIPFTLKRTVFNE